MVRDPQPASVPSDPIPSPWVHVGSFVAVAGLTGWGAAGLRAQACSTFPAGVWLAIILWALVLWLVLFAAVRLCRSPGTSLLAETSRVLILGWFCVLTFRGYFNAQRVGPLDAQWYENVITDYLTQARAGTFPVLVGATQYAFNGAVHPFRSAPWQFIFADGVDLASGRTLAPVAIQHLTAIGSYLAAVLLLYVGLVRSRPAGRWTAFAFALGYAMSPAVTVPFFQFDMYMTLTAQPAMIAALLAVQRILDDESPPAWGWLGVSLAALWYCHPPMALLTSLAAAGGILLLLAVQGFTARRLGGFLFFGMVWAALASPYFRSMAELARSESDWLAAVVMPATGLGLLLFSTGGFLRSGSLLWLALAPSGLACLHAFQPEALPFGAAFLGFSLLAAWIRRRGWMDNDVVALTLCAVLAGLVSAWGFPHLSLRNPFAEEAVRTAAGNWKHFFQPVFLGTGTRVQPGYLLWGVLAGLWLFCGLGRSFFVRCSVPVTLVFVIALGFCGPLSQLLWQTTPADLTNVIGVAYDLRLLPVLAVVAVIAGFYWVAGLPTDRSWVTRGATLVLVGLGGWSLWQHGVILHEVRTFHLDPEQTAAKNRTENVALERYSWDLLPPPRYLDFGVMDPALETRFWGDVSRGGQAIGPDEIEQALEVSGQKPIPVQATVIPNARIWLELSPKIELGPGQHVLLRFDFLGKRPQGTLVIRGQSIYREYQLPSSGRDYAFGAAPGNSRTLSLWNSGSVPESVTLLVVRAGDHASEDPGPGPYCLLYETPFDLGRSPIRLESLVPLKVGVSAPTGGYLESFRTLIPGYKAYLDGRPVPVMASRNALVSVRVPPGRHEVWFRFTGTTTLHTAVRLAEVEWALVALLAFTRVGWLFWRGRPFRTEGMVQ